MTPANKSRFYEMGRDLIKWADENPSADLCITRLLVLLQKLTCVLQDLHFRPEANDE